MNATYQQLGRKLSSNHSFPVIHHCEWELIQSDTEKRTLEEMKFREKEIADLNDRDIVKGLTSIQKWTNKQFESLDKDLVCFLSESRITNDMRYSTIRISIDDALEVNTKSSFWKRRREKNVLFETRTADEIAKMMHMASTPATETGLTSNIVSQMIWITDVRQFKTHNFDFKNKFFDALIKRWTEAWKASKQTLYNQSRLPQIWKIQQKIKEKQAESKPIDAKFNDGPIMDPIRKQHWLIFNNNQTTESVSHSLIMKSDFLQRRNLLSKTLSFLNNTCKKKSIK